VNRVAPRRSRPLSFAAVATALSTGLSAAVLTAALTPAQAAVKGRELNLQFEPGSQRTNAGGTALSVRTVTRNGGSVTTAKGRSGSAVRFPAFRASNPPVAALAVTDRNGADDLAPGNATFRFGADFTLDATSQGSTIDNGNNLVQRGLYRDRMQYKIELDGKRPACRVKGSSGAVTVRSSTKVATGTWYRAVCERNGSKVTLTVKRLGTGKKWVDSASRSTGKLRPASRSVPLSVGGKLDASGRLVRSADQFNGRVDNAFVNVF
jgi:Laminin G domain